MTDRDFDRIVGAWLDLMPSEAPDRTIESVLQTVERTPQAWRPVFGLPWRSPMNRFSLIAATTLLITALAGGLWVLGSGGPGPAVPTPAASPTPTPRQSVVAPSQTIWGDWLADVPSIPEITMPAGMIQLSIDWENGDEVWLQTIPDFRQLLSSAPLAAPAGELHLRSNLTNTLCEPESVGRYGWVRSSDGLFLTLTLIEDACPTRAIVFARTWVHSLGAVNDGGPGVAYGVTPMTQVTLPTGTRYGARGGEQSQDIATFGDTKPFRAFVVVRNPGGFGAPCSSTDTQEQDIAHTIEAFTAYVQALPGATVTTEPVQVGGRPGVRLDVSIDQAVECRTDGIQAFHPENLADDYAWAFQPGEVESLYVVQMDAETTFLLWYQGSADEEEAVIDSISFIERLPTP